MELIFRKFLQRTDEENKILKRKMRDALSDFETGNNNMYFSCLKVSAIDAGADVNFSSVTCKVKVMGLKDTEDMAPVGCFFAIGCKILKEILADEPQLPLDENHERSLSCLLQFLSSDHSILLRRTENESEGVIARRYAEHLLMPLADYMKYVIDTYPGVKFSKCCDVEHPFKGNCGDTSFGLQDGWHGKVNILIMGKNKEGLPIFIGDSTEDDILVSSGEGKSDNSYTQMIAETVVFSFLQHKQNFGKLRNYLIPGIGIKCGKLVVFMYDCENDVLLGSHTVDLIEGIGGRVSVRSIMFLWLILNYKLFCTGVIDDFKSYKANVHTLLGSENLERYRTEVDMPFRKKYSQNKTFDPDSTFQPMSLRRKLNSYPVVPLKKYKSD